MLFLSSSTGGSDLPFCVGFPFREGQVPAGKSVAVAGMSLQVTVKARWPDGSARHAVLAGRATLAAGEVRGLPVVVSEPAGGVPLTTTALRATGVAATVDCGGFGTVQWASTDWDSPLRTWVAGPQMASWIYRKPVGSDAHLVAWLEVRLWASGAVEILPWIENGYIRVPAHTSKAATYRFLLNGSERFAGAIDLPARCRTPLVSGAQLSHWLGGAPALAVSHDRTYLQATQMVPSYWGTVAATAAVVGRLPTSYSPLQQGGYSGSMGQGGYQEAIGLLPLWDVVYLTCSTSNLPYEALQRNAYSAGRYPIHYRDETTLRPLRFSRYPNLSVNASTLNDVPVGAGGTAAPAWDVPHHPSVGYLAYLVTARWYFLEELQFAATMNYIVQVDNVRGFANGVFVSSSGASTVRGAGWAVRTLAQAAAVTPDDDAALQGEFIASLRANIEFNHGRYVAQPHNPFGIVATYGDAYGTDTDGRVTDAPWMQDFYTAAYGHALALRPNIGATSLAKLDAFFAWKARSIIGRLGGTSSSEWLYRDAARYTMAVAPVDWPDWVGGTGPWFADWGALYRANFGVDNPGEVGDLRGAYFPEPTSYWGNLQPAIAYAVQHAVPGAAAAYARMTGAANWSQILQRFNDIPVWGVRPRTTD